MDQIKAILATSHQLGGGGGMQTVSGLVSKKVIKTAVIKL